MAREPGDKLAPKLIHIISQTVIATKKGLAWHEKEVRRTATQEVIDGLGRGIAELYRPMVDKLLANDTGSLSPELQAIMHAAKSGDHQEQAIAGLLLGPVAGAIGTLLNNELVDVVYPIVRQSPNIHNPVDAQAEAAARGIISYGHGASLSADQGTPGDQWDNLYQLAQNPPDATSLFQMFNRGLIDKGTVEFWLKHSAYHDNIIGPLSKLSEQILAPADLALASLRGNIDQGEAQRIAAQSGVSPADFQILIGNTGEPPGVFDMLRMVQRGIIDRATYTKGAKESRLRNEWIDPVFALRFNPMTTADAIEAAVQNHIGNAQAKSISEQNGLEPDHFDILYQTAGEPLSKTELLTLLKRGVIDEATVKQGLRESRLKDKYVDTALHLARAIPPLFTIRSMVTAGQVSDQLATKWLSEDGYDEQTIKAVLGTAHHTKTVKQRDLTEGMLSELYQEQAITADDFKSHLKQLGYSDTEADLIVKLDDWKIVKSQRDIAISHVRASYVGHKISEQEAVHQLDALHVPATMRDKILPEWELERKSAVRLLTPAQIAAAWRLQLMSTADALTYLENLGYSLDDATLLIILANKGQPIPAGR